MNERGRHAGIHPAAQAENDALISDLPANLVDRLVEVIVHRPIPAAAADAMDEVADDLGTAGRMDHLGMELQPEKLFRAMLDRGIIRIISGGNALKTAREPGQPVAVRIP